MPWEIFPSWERRMPCPTPWLGGRQAPHHLDRRCPPLGALNQFYCQRPRKRSLLCVVGATHQSADGQRVGPRGAGKKRVCSLIWGRWRRPDAESRSIRGRPAAYTEDHHSITQHYILAFKIFIISDWCTFCYVKKSKHGSSVFGMMP
jgi:hypothetical protein